MTRFLLLWVALLFCSLSTLGGVWKGINLDYLTDAHQDLVKGYPCEVRFEQFYLNDNFGDPSEGALEEKETLCYDKYGYKSKDGDYSIKNEYQDGKILKRTWTKNGATVRVHHYDYDTNKGTITLTKYSQWGLDDVYVYSMTGGKLMLKKKSDGSIIQKFNSSGLIEWEADPYNDHKTNTYVKGLLKRVQRGHSSTPNKVYSGYMTDSHRNWTRRIISNEDNSTPLQGNLYEDKVGQSYNRIQKRQITYLNPTK